MLNGVAQCAVVVKMVFEMTLCAVLFCQCLISKCLTDFHQYPLTTS